MCALRKICCFNLTKLTKISSLEDLKLSILWKSAVLYSRYLKKGANIVPICREQSSNRVPSHIFYPNMPFFLKRFICHIFIFHVCPYAAFFFNFFSLPSSFMFVVALSFAPHSSTFLSPISLDLITHTEFNKKSFTEMSIQISMWNLSFWDPLSGGRCYPLLEQDSL